MFFISKPIFRIDFVVDDCVKFRYIFLTFQQIIYLFPIVTNSFLFSKENSSFIFLSNFLILQFGSLWYFSSSFSSSSISCLFVSQSRYIVVYNCSRNIKVQTYLTGKIKTLQNKEWERETQTVFWLHHRIMICGVMFTFTCARSRIRRGEKW